MVAEEQMMRRVINYLISIPSEVEAYTLGEVIHFLNSVATMSLPPCCRDTYEELKESLIDLRSWIPEGKEYDEDDDHFIRQAEEFNNIIQNYIVHLRATLLQASS